MALFELFDSLLVLLMLGRRSHKLRAEVGKALATAPSRATTPQAIALRAECGHQIELVCELAGSLLEESASELDQMLLSVAQKYLGPEVDLTSDEEVRDVALTLPLLSWEDGITDGKRLAFTFTLAVAAAELPAERFYLPREVHDALRKPWTPEHTWMMLEPMMRVAAGQLRPARREEPKLGRNAPCPCGSGKKYKRCCAR